MAVSFDMSWSLSAFPEPAFNKGVRGYAELVMGTVPKVLFRLLVKVRQSKPRYVRILRVMYYECPASYSLGSARVVCVLFSIPICNSSTSVYH